MSSNPRTVSLLAALADRYPSEEGIITVTAGLAPAALEFLTALANDREDLRYEGAADRELSWASARDYLVAVWADEVYDEVRVEESGGEFRRPLPGGLSLREGAIRLPDGKGVPFSYFSLHLGGANHGNVVAWLRHEAEDRARSYVDRKLREAVEGRRDWRAERRAERAAFR